MVMKKIEQLLNKNQLGRILSIPLNRIKPSKYQPRTDFNDLEIMELAQSIQVYGVIQPIILRSCGDYYEIIAGERRYRACKILALKEIPAIIQEMDDEKAASIALIENLQRKDLNYFEEAMAYYVLLHQFDMTQEDLALRIGKSQSAIANKLRLLKLPEEVRARISADRISERHARALLKLENANEQMLALREIYEKELNVRQTEELIESILENAIPQDSHNKDNSKHVSMIIRDARIFLNTIKETVNRARKTGIDMLLNENDNEDCYELHISIPKVRKNINKMIK